jgi:UDP-N-acetylglucosamine--N-acetylmuramyl-(pentapeptide) pyrophosphoryl-undecaprenol N-acetylglucosamine transferase
VGAASLLVPYPSAVDDHQTHNARFLVDGGAAWLEAQADLTPDKLAALLQGVDRTQLLAMAQKAHALAKTGATEAVVEACIELAKVRTE